MERIRQHYQILDIQQGRRRLEQGVSWSDASLRLEQGLRQWPLDGVLMGAGLVLLAYWSGPAAESSSSLSRTLLVFAACAVVVAYGTWFTTLAPLYCWVFMAPLYLADGIGKLLIAGTIVTLAVGRKRGPWRWRFSTFGLYFCLWSLASLLWAKVVVTESGGFLWSVLPYVILAIVVSGISDPELPRNVGFIVACSTVVGAFGTVWNWLYGQATAYNEAGEYQSFIQPDIFSPWCIWGVLGAFVIYLDRPRSQYLARFMAIAAALYILLAVGLSGIRSSILALCFGLFVLVLCSRYRRPVLLPIAVVGVGIVLLAFSTLNPFEAVTGRFAAIHEDGGSHRLDIWDVGLQQVYKNPLMGVGWDNFGPATARVLGRETVSHNIYIGTLVELGIVGEVLMLGWFGVVLRKAWRSANRTVVLPLLACYLFQGLFLHQFIVPYTWLALGLAESCRPEPVLPEYSDGRLPACDNLCVLPMRSTREVASHGWHRK
jgi:hypothetical protein